jgi:Holliday junction resolvase
MGSKRCGTRYEQRLVRFLDAAGYVVMKSPSSGSATDRDQPDVYAAAPGECVAIEQKYEGSRDGIIYLSQHEINALERFAALAGATAVISTRWKHDTTFYLFEIDALERTKSGDGAHYRVTREMADGDAARLLADEDGDWSAVDGGSPRATPSHVRRYGVVPHA